MYSYNFKGLLRRHTKTPRSYELLCLGELLIYMCIVKTSNCVFIKRYIKTRQCWVVPLNFWHLFMCVSLRNCVLFATVHTTAPQRTEWDDPLSAKLSFSTHSMSSSTPMSAPYWKTPRRFPRAVSRARLYHMGAPLVGNESPASTRLTPVNTNWSDALLQVYTSTSRWAPLRLG